jgi:hypothetical protein
MAEPSNHLGSLWQEQKQELLKTESGPLAKSIFELSADFMVLFDNLY